MPYVTLISCEDINTYIYDCRKEFKYYHIITNMTYVLNINDLTFTFK